jgi:3-deoxy-manno-octulosonate cytidylyltransferase (CMP-KDO synthetase)
VVRIRNAEEVRNPNVVKVVADKHGYALYFSRAPIPYYRDEKGHSKQIYYRHLGLYAYTKDFLFTFRNLPVSKLEKAEKLEQLRALEHGYRIRAIETKYDTIGIDTPEDLELARKKLQEEMAEVNA